MRKYHWNIAGARQCQSEVNSKLNDLLRLHFLSEKGAGGVNVVKTVDFWQCYHH
jgi:hypothetical protein